VLVCADGYLVADPSITCWEGGHIPLVFAGLLALPFFLIGIPMLYAYILFGIVRTRGPDHPVVSKHYGFLYSRFEPQFFWFEYIELFRKLIFVCASVFGSQMSPLMQIFCSSLAVSIVLMFYLRDAPYALYRHDILSTTLCIMEILLLFLGISVLYRNATELEVDDAPFAEPLAWAALAVALLVTLYCSYVDIYHATMNFAFDRRAAHWNVKLNQRVFNRQRARYLLYRWVLSLSEAEISQLQLFEQAMAQARVLQSSILPSAKAKRYRRLIDDEPRLLDWAMNEKTKMELRRDESKLAKQRTATNVLKAMGGFKKLSGSTTDMAGSASTLSTRTEVQQLVSKYVKTIETDASLMECTPAKHYFVPQLHGVLLEWAVETADREELATMRSVLASIRKYEAGILSTGARITLGLTRNRTTMFADAVSASTASLGELADTAHATIGLAQKMGDAAVDDLLTGPVVSMEEELEMMDASTMHVPAPASVVSESTQSSHETACRAPDSEQPAGSVVTNAIEPGHSSNESELALLGI